MMNKETLLTRSILGPYHGNIRDLTCCLEVAGEQLFRNEKNWEEVCITKDIYWEAAKRLNKRPSTVTRNAERLARHCWGTLNEAQILQYIGRPLHRLGSPADLLFYLAFYIQYDQPFYRVVQERYDRLLFTATCPQE